MITDSHIHLKCLLDKNSEDIDFIKRNDYHALCSCHSRSDLEAALEIAGIKNVDSPKLFISYGIHPFDSNCDEIEYLENLASEKIISAVGEAGLDRYNEELKSTIERQIEIFNLQIDIAVKYSLPMVLHIRKAIPELFSLCGKLSKLPAVVFHSYGGTDLEAEYILKKNVNAYFSFGTPVISGNKKAENSLSNIPVERIVLETDAPYQPLQGETYTKASDILKVISRAAEIKKKSSTYIMEKVYENFQNILTN